MRNVYHVFIIILYYMYLLGLYIYYKFSIKSMPHHHNLHLLATLIRQNQFDVLLSCTWFMLYYWHSCFLRIYCVVIYLFYNITHNLASTTIRIAVFSMFVSLRTPLNVLCLCSSRYEQSLILHKNHVSV